MEVLKITAKNYTLNFEQLECLMHEFFLRLFVASQQEPNELERGIFEFGAEEQGFDSKELIKEAEMALTCFRLKNKK